MHQRITIALLGLLAAICAVPALAQVPNPADAPNPNDPTVNQVYDAARAGHFDQAKQMMTLVLANHPRSARAHYVAAELDADMKNYGEARQELKAAEDIDPGLPNVPPQALAALRKEIGAPPPAPAPANQATLMHPPIASAPAAGAPVAVSAPAASAPPSAKPFRWGMLWVVGAVLIFLWLLMRRRRAPAPAYTPPGTTPSAPPGGFPNVVAGGAGIVGGLASGLAVGAGVAAGEELVRHAFESHHEGHEAGAGTPLTPEPPDGGANADMGGPNFGISDPGGSWDDGSASSGDDGGGDWT